jgi:hypothetical protein
LSIDHKAFVKVACGSHFLIYENYRSVLHAASKEWLLHGTVNGMKQGYLSADANGRIR